MPTFKEKCPEFGQKIRIKDSNHKFFIFIEERNGDYHLASEHCGVNGFGPSWEWEPITEEPQWTQITEDESTWPPLDVLVCVDDTVHGNTSYMRTGKIIDRLIGKNWTHFPKRKKEEKTHLGDGSAIEARLLKLEMDVKFIKEKIGLFEILEEEKSPWISASLKPMHGNEVLVRSKLSTGEFIYGIGCIFKGVWSLSNCARPEEWMEIPK